MYPTMILNYVHPNDIYQYQMEQQYYDYLNYYSYQIQYNQIYNSQFWSNVDQKPTENDSSLYKSVQTTKPSVKKVDRPGKIYLKSSSTSPVNKLQPNQTVVPALKRKRESVLPTVIENLNMKYQRVAKRQKIFKPSIFRSIDELAKSSSRRH